MPRNLEILVRSEAFVADQVLSLVERQSLGTPGSCEVRLVIERYVGLEELVGARTQIQFGYPGEVPHVFWGIIESAEVESNPVDEGQPMAPTYRIHVVSRLQLLEQSRDARIFQELDVQEIVSQVLEAHGMVLEDFEWRLSGTYPKREYCVQYNETALNFISRLLEEEGIYFFSELDPEAEAEHIVFADDSTRAEAILGTSPLPLRAASQLNDQGTAVYRLNQRHAAQSGKVTLRAFNFKRPDLDLTSMAQADVFPELEVYDFPDDYVDGEEGQRRSQVRLEEMQCQRHTLEISADEPTLHVGQQLAIEAEDERSYFCTSTLHEYRRDPLLREQGAGGDTYQVTAELVPLDVIFRPRRLHSKPVIFGPQTATVVAPEGSEAEEIFTDEHGRCKVKFHWDRGSEFFDRASCWMRVGQLQSSGSMVLPRVNWEVIVEFLEGDPDRPVVTGRLYNGTFMPPYQLPEGRTRTSLQTASTPAGGGSNEIRFEDKAGAEEIMIHSQYDTAIAAANNRVSNVGNNQTLVVGNNATLEVGANETIQITNGFQNTIGAAQTVDVGGNRSVEVNAVYGLTVAGSSETTVGGNHMEMVGNPLEGLLSLATAKAAELATAAATKAMGQVEAAVQGKVAQALGPINDLISEAEALGGRMEALANGDLTASAGLLGAVGGLPGPSAMVGSLAAGPAVTRAAPGTESSSGEVALNAAMSSAISSAAGKGLARVKQAIGAATGQDAAGVRGQSQANVAGPVGDVGGISEADATAGPGHSQYKVTADHSETIGAMRVTAAAGTVATNVKAAMSQSVGAAHLEFVLGDRAESVEGAKSEAQVGLIVVSKGGESETAEGARDNTVGGALLQSIKGSHMVEAGAAATLVGALHKLEASAKIVFKCGASSLTVDGGGITIQSPAVNFSASSITVTKNASES